MKIGKKLAMLASASVLLGMSSIPAVAQESSLPSLPEPVSQLCPNGRPPIRICEIINGRKVCHIECD